MKTLNCTALITLALGTVACHTASGATFFQQNPYLSAADIPAGFYGGGSPQALENFEDGTLDFGITADNGGVIPPGFSGAIDSVAGDGNPSDPLGVRGHSWFSGSGSVTLTIPSGHTAAGVVWTDGANPVFVEFFGPGGSLGVQGPFNIADGSFFGTTGEDTFFGLQDPGGITQIHIWNLGGGIELDHGQYGLAPTPTQPSVPELGSSVICLLLGLAGVMGFKNHTKRS